MENKYAQNFFCTILSAVEKNHINLLQVGWDRCAPRYTYTNFRDMYIIHFVKSGHGVFETNGKKYYINPNDAYIVRPNTLAVQTADEKDPWEFCFFAFNGDLAEYYVEKTAFKDNTVSVTIENEKIWQTMILQLNLIITVLLKCIILSAYIKCFHFLKWPILLLKEN